MISTNMEAKNGWMDGWMDGYGWMNGVWVWVWWVGGCDLTLVAELRQDLQ